MQSTPKAPQTLQNLDAGEIYEGPPIPITADSLQTLFPSKPKKKDSPSAKDSTPSHNTRPVPKGPEAAKAKDGKKPTPAGTGTPNRKRVVKREGLSTKKGDLLKAYRKRKPTSGRLPDEAIVALPLNDIAYDHIIQLFESYGGSAIARMINARRSAEEQVGMCTVDKRLRYAIPRVAIDNGESAVCVLARLNAKRAGHGLPPIVLKMTTDPAAAEFTA